MVPCDNVHMACLFYNMLITKSVRYKSAYNILITHMHCRSTERTISSINVSFFVLSVCIFHSLSLSLCPLPLSLCWAGLPLSVNRILTGVWSSHQDGPMNTLTVRAPVFHFAQAFCTGMPEQWGKRALHLTEPQHAHTHTRTRTHTHTHAHTTNTHTHTQPHVFGEYWESKLGHWWPNSTT